MVEIDLRNLIVTYRYAIAMPDRKVSYYDLMNKWLTEPHLSQIYNGKLLLSISPISTDGTHLFTQIALDIEGGKNTKEAFNFSTRFINHNKDFYMTYTGKTGFHIFSKFLVMTDIMHIQDLRYMLIDPLNISTSMLDYNSSIRNVPMIRIGYRHDTHTLATPVSPTINYNTFVKKMTNVTDFKTIMSLKDMKKFISSKIFPANNIINHKTYLRKIKHIIDENNEYVF